MALGPTRDVAAPLTPAQPSRRGWLVARVLVAVGLAIGLVPSLAPGPVQRDLLDLLAALEAGEVTTLDIERPSTESEYGLYGGDLLVQWDTGWRGAWTTYGVQGGDGLPSYDEGEEILAAAEASPRTVAVVVHDDLATPTVRLHWVVGGLAGLAGLILLVTGPQPRYATKWAWFWLFSVPPMMTVWAIAEPVPLWARDPRPYPDQRLQGRWAFPLALVGGSLLAALWWILFAVVLV